MPDNNDNLDEPLSDDPEENLRLENQLLHLKLKAQFGADSQSFGGLPPEIENEFLKNVLAFENASADIDPDAPPITVYEKLGKPAFTPAAELDDAALETALEQVCDMMAENFIEVDFSGEYDNRTKYVFITEELFPHEMGFFGMSAPGMTTHYLYEEFHPNHKLDIESKASRFINGWLEQNINEYSGVDDIVLPERRVLPQAEVIKKLQQFFDCYTSFTDIAFEIFETAFELYPETETGMGHAEGAIKYTATLESGEQVPVKGIFKLYMSLQYGCWGICYFVMPGFEF